MKIFLCVLDPNGCGIGEETMREYECLPRRRGLQVQWRAFGQAAVLTACDDPCDIPSLVCDGYSIGVGMARLDNRAEVRRMVRGDVTGLTDLALILAAVKRLGAECIREILGDFAFVIWDAAARQSVAACDALGVKKLYYTSRDGLHAFASHVEPLASGERYDIEYLAEQVAACDATPELTVYEDVKAIRAGSMVVVEPGRLVVRTYWSPEAVAQRLPPRTTLTESVEEFRRLFVEAVRSRLPIDGGAWAQLSGGLDSSSVASVAQWLVSSGATARGLDGTVTYVDRRGTPSDEREYSDVIVSRWGLRNETIIDPPMWYDERCFAPRLDQPRHNFMFYPRECRLCEVVRGASGRVLLTGQGPDEYLRGSMFFFADWLAQGRIFSAVREMARRAAIGRVSLWDLAYQNAVMPLLPERLRLKLGPAVTQLPEWVHPAIARRYALHERRLEIALYSGPMRQKYRHSVVKGVRVLAATIGHLVLDDHLDVRHPFLDRRLVEFGLALPPELTTQPYAGKWVLREAMRDVVPEVVRTRIGKGTQAERHAWALTAQRTLLEPLVREPVLADLGVVDGSKLRSAFQSIPHQPRRTNDPHAAMEQVLAIEAWLQIRAGRWPRGLLD
jgi:asparagine synthase (glutamine-hydrolysing)